MQIILDGKPVPVNTRINRDLLITLKGMAKMLNWELSYDASKEQIIIKSPNFNSTLAYFPERVETMNLEPESNRLAGKIFCIDPGHGGSDSGANGPTGTIEKENTMAVSLQLCDKLDHNGATVFLTHSSDKDVAYPGATQTEELGARVDIANNAQADIFISIHNASFTDRSAAGSATFHYGDKDSIRLAVCVQHKIVEKLGIKDRGTRFASLYVLRYTKMPAILVETAFISNPEEELLLSCLEGRQNIADAIFEGIVLYLKV